MFIENFRKFIDYFGEKRKLKFCGFIILSLIAGFLEFIGIALIYPFIILIVRPEAIINTTLYQHLTFLTHSSNTTMNALALGALALCLFIFKNIYMIYFYFLQSKFINNWKRDISNKFMQYYIFSSYKDSIKSSQSDKSYVLTTLCPQALNIFIFRIIALITNTIIVSMIITLILIKFPAAALVTITFIILSMLIQNKFFKKKMFKINRQMNKENRIFNDIKYTNIENLKEIKILSAEQEFYETYCDQSEKINYYQCMAEYYSSIPPYIIEILIVAAMIILGAFLSLGNINNQTVMIASFSLVAAAIFRIAPALNRIQTAIINISNGRTFVKALLLEYEKCNIKDFKPVYTKDKNKFGFTKKIEFRNINFEYKEGKPVLKNISFEINKGDFVGIIGLSGAGKSTIADILMGLLPPSSGEIFVDGNKLNPEEFAKFRQIIGYVPQEIKVLNKSFKENVAWGVKPEEIDIDRVTRALYDAKLYDFVKQFENNIDAVPFIGSTGASLGQKQRLAIARALYKEPEILIFDEATSALDVKTEHEITDMLTELGHDKTIVAIAHRLSTLKSCNKLIYIKEGEIVDIGTFEELSSSHADFENLIKLSTIK